MALALRQLNPIHKKRGHKVFFNINDIINIMIYLQSSSQVMLDKEKQGKRKIQKFEYLENEEIFLDELGKANLIFVVLV